jgi:thymidylate kinase
MTTKPLLVGFEGPCLAGKTAVIRTVHKRLATTGWAVLDIPEYTVYAGGHQNLPGVIPPNDKAAVQYARFFIDLEAQRRKDISRWLAAKANDRAIVLIDRLILSCLIVQQRVDDKVGAAQILGAIARGLVILPDLTVFLRLSAGQEEYAQRLAQRAAFPNSHVVYEPSGYEDFFRHFNAEVANLNPFYFDSSQTDHILDAITSFAYGTEPNDSAD